MPKLTRKTISYAEHKLKWMDCTACPLHEFRTRIVLARGQVPAPLLFIGEAPGTSEDVLGRPFVGPAGKLLDHIIYQASVTIPYAMTNLAACIPKDDDSNKIHEPPEDSVEACSDRLQEFIGICNPRAIIAVGKVAEYYLWKQEYQNRYIFGAIAHPAAILRLNVMQQGLAVQRAVTVVEDVVEKL